MRAIYLSFLFLSGVLMPACAGMPPDPIALENRSLRLSREVPGFEYNYEVCIKKFLGICTRKQWTKDVYDLRDEATREQLINMGFIGKVREKLP